MTGIPLDKLTETQVQRTRCLEVAFAVLAGSGATYAFKAKMAYWLSNGQWPEK